MAGSPAAVLVGVVILARWVSIGGWARSAVLSEVAVASQQRSMADCRAGAASAPVGRGACVGKKPAANRVKVFTPEATAPGPL